MHSISKNMIAGAALGSLLVFLLLGFFSEKIYSAGGHEGDHTLAFALDTGEDEAAAGAEEEPAVSLASLVADADADAGAKVFNQCRACHKIEDGANGIGPHLWNVMGREIASVEGFSYSSALSAKDGEWVVANMSAWLENPAEWAPGTSMGYAGLPDPQDRVNLMAYINRESGDPVDLAAMVPDAPAEAEGEPEAEAATAAPSAEGEDMAAAETGEASDDAAAEKTDTAATDEGGAYAALLANASAENGKKVYNQCRACHKVQDGVNGVGPHLYNVVGREIASVEDYTYSDALSAKEGDWTLDNMMAWLGDPGEFAPGNKMGYALRGEQDRIDVITYLNQAGSDPVDLGGGSDRAAAETPEEETATAAADDQPADSETGMAAADEQAADGSEASEAGTAADETEAEATQAATDGADSQYAALLAEASAEEGKKVFNRCRACHKVEDGVNGVGPHLYGVIGREIASVEEYSYSDALSAKKGDWTLDDLMAWLGAPGEFAPGNKMGYALSDEQDRINVITYLNEADGSPEPLE